MLEISIEEDLVDEFARLARYMLFRFLPVFVRCKILHVKWLTISVTFLYRLLIFFVIKKRDYVATVTFLCCFNKRDELIPFVNLEGLLRQFRACQVNHDKFLCFGDRVALVILGIRLLSIFFCKIAEQGIINHISSFFFIFHECRVFQYNLNKVFSFIQG